MTALLPDTFVLIALLSAVVVLWVALGRLILNMLTGKAVERYETTDKRDAGTISWPRRSMKKKRAA